MATSGTYTNNFTSGYSLRIVWTEKSQSVADNSTTVEAKVQLVSAGSSYYISSSATKDGSLTINGTKYTFTFTAGMSGGQTKTLYTKTVTISHNADGSKQCAFSASAGLAVTLAGVYIGTETVSGTGTFDVIARASGITSVTASVSVNGTNACAVSIDRKSTSFTHKVVFKFGSYSETKTGVATSTSYAIPVSWLNAMPNATSGTATVTVTTLSGSTQIGNTISKNFTLTAPSTVVPTITSVTLSETVAGIAAKFGAYVQGKSKVKAVTVSAGVYSSAISTVKVTVDGKTYTGANITSGLISASGTVAVQVVVTDSRGRTATKTQNITVVAYAPIVLRHLKASRSNAAGVYDDEGAHLKAEVQYTVSSVGGKNTAAYKLEYKESTASTWTTLATGTALTYTGSSPSASAILNVNKQYNVRVQVTDFFGTVTSNVVNIGTAFTLMDFHASGKGIAFGKVAQEEGIADFDLKIKCKNGEIPQGAIPLESGADLNSLLGVGYYYIPTTAISGTILNKPFTQTSTGVIINLKGGSTDQITQVCIRAQKMVHSGIWERQYYTGGWGAWNCINNGGGRVLWSGAWYGGGGQTADLSEAVSAQPTGIMLVFSRYTSGTAHNYNFNHCFVSKEFVRLHEGAGSQFFLTTDGLFNAVASKYFYISDNFISGNNNNIATGSASGITYVNNQFVLRYVIGV